MRKDLKKAFAEAGWIERFLAAAVAFLFFVYAFYFLLVPQHWSLIDHYSQVRLWGRGDFDAVAEWKRFLGNLASIGRFRPIDIATWMFRYKYLPVTPRAFHLVQFGMIGVLFAFLGGFAFSATRSLRHALFVLLLAAGALPLKDFIFHTSASDPLGSVFLFGAIAAYGTGRKGWAIPLFFAAFLTKESYFVFFFVFAALEFFANKPKRGFRRFIPLVVMGAGAAAWVLFIRSLPQIYTAGFGLAKASPRGLITALVFPALRNYLPVFALVAYSRWKGSRIRTTDPRFPLIVAGLSVVTVYTAFMTLWGPFDSWLYMHIPLPFGWALLFAGLWNSDRKTERDPIAAGLLFAVSAFLAFLVLNGGRNFDVTHSEFKIVAKMACEDATLYPKMRFFTNCNEGALQFHHYLVLEKICENPPEFEYLAGRGKLPEDARPPYSLVTMRRCDDPIDPSTVPADHEIALEWWNVRKKFKP